MERTSSRVRFTWRCEFPGKISSQCETKARRLFLPRPCYSKLFEKSSRWTTDSRPRCTPDFWRVPALYTDSPRPPCDQNCGQKIAVKKTVSGIELFPRIFRFMTNKMYYGDRNGHIALYRINHCEVIISLFAKVVGLQKGIK